MKWRYFLFTLLFFSVVGFISAETVNVDVSLMPASENIAPEGGHPKNEHHYNTFDLQLQVPPFPKNNEYYVVDVKLTSSKNKGYAANFGDTKDWDLKFNSADYPDLSTPQWRYRSKKHLSYEISSNMTERSAPTKISVRCYDWGAYGEVTVTVKKKTGWLRPDVELGSDSARVPKDANENNIFDGWEDDGEKGYNADVDDEDVPKGTYQKGDGWTVYDEYRGLFLTKNDTKVKRLDPAAKNVLICYETGMETYGTGTYSIPYHTFDTIKHEIGLITDPFVNVHKTKKEKITGKTTEVFIKKEKAGWVNKNSEASKVWAIRVEKSSKVFGGENKHKLGDANEGSPSYFSKIRIYPTNIEYKIVRPRLEDAGVIRSRDDRERENDAKKDAAEDAIINASIDTWINGVLSHEIGHSLAISHCTHSKCIMNKALKGGYDKNTKTWIFNVNGFDAAHDLGYAATNLIGNTIIHDDICTILEDTTTTEETSTTGNIYDNGGNIYVFISDFDSVLFVSLF